MKNALLPLPTRHGPFKGNIRSEKTGESVQGAMNATLRNATNEILSKTRLLRGVRLPSLPSSTPVIMATPACKSTQAHRRIGLFRVKHLHPRRSCNMTVLAARCQL